MTNAFSWRGLPSASGKDLGAKVNSKAPSPASQISYSTKTPHSINTEPVKHGDKLQQLRKGTLNPGSGA